MATRDISPEERVLLGLDNASSGLLPSILSSLNLSLVSLITATTGKNNHTFILSLSHLSDNPPVSSMSNKAGTSPLPTTATFAAVFRTSVKNEDMDPDLLAANQVAALKLVRDAAGEAAKVVPRVYAWSTTVHGREPWSLMEFKEGVPLSSVWDDYSHTEKVALMPSLATLLASLQSTPLPSAPLPIGSFGFEDATDLDSPVTIVESQFHYGGPYATPRDLYRGIILSQWEALRNKAPRLEGWRGWSFECHEGKFQLSEALERWVEIVREDGERWRELSSGLDGVGPTVIHGDFGNLNVLVDPATKEITAILDFEFSQCGPFHDEYFQGLIDYSLLQEGTRTHDATPAALALQPFSLHPTPTDAPDSLDGGAKDDFLIGQALALSLHAAGAKGPWTQPDSFESVAHLYWHAQDLCPGFMQRERFWIKCPEEKRVTMVKEHAERLGEDMKRWGI